MYRLLDASSTLPSALGEHRGAHGHDGEGHSMGSRREDVMSSMVIGPTNATVRLGMTIDVEDVEKVAKGRGCR